MDFFKLKKRILITTIIIIMSFSSLLCSTTESVPSSKSIKHQDYIIIIWDFDTKEVRQNETFSLKVTIINPTKENLSVWRIGVNFDWLNESNTWTWSSSIFNDTYLNYTYYYCRLDNRTIYDMIPSGGFQNYFFNVTVDSNIPIGNHQYHFFCMYLITPFSDPWGSTEEGYYIDTYPKWRSEIFSDFIILEIDADKDGISDSQDVFPEDRYEYFDSDCDGKGNNEDAFPFNPYEWLDSDGDGYGDNIDRFQNNSIEWYDSDGDGIGDNADSFPYDPSAYIDLDQDGHPDLWNINMSGKDSTIGLTFDHYPNNPNKWNEEEKIDTLRLHITLGLFVFSFLLIFGIIFSSSIRKKIIK